MHCPHSPQLEKAHSWQQRPSPAKDKTKKKKLLETEEIYETMKDPEKVFMALLENQKTRSCLHRNVPGSQSTFVAQQVQRALHDAAKGSTRGRPVYKDCGRKRGFGLITECWVVPGQGTELGPLRAAGRVPQCRVACGGATLLLLA